MNSLTDHPDAPDDPVLSWVRLRQRGDSWRIALRGLHRWNLPGPVRSEQRGDSRTLHTPQGRFEYSSDAPVSHSLATPDGWLRDTRPSLAAAQPYPRTGITWSVSP